MEDNDVLDVLRAYPQIYLACHVEHRTRAKSATGLTDHDGSLLAHIEEQGSSPAVLARHLGVSPSTLSAAIARLERRGLVRMEPVAGDGRRRRVLLTTAGHEAAVRDSVLDVRRVAALLDALSPAERRRAVAGLKLLAVAVRAFRERTE
jgi:DNA-binding MarR family transcriptional regulator